MCHVATGFVLLAIGSRAPKLERVVKSLVAQLRKALSPFQYFVAGWGCQLMNLD